jgi:hypothetical protein
MKSRRRINSPKAREHADNGSLHQGFATGEMGFNSLFAQQQFSKAMSALCRYCCKSRRCPARRAKTGNNRIQTTAFVNQYFLSHRNAGKVFFAPASKIILQQYRPIADIPAALPNVRFWGNSGHQQAAFDVCF